MSKESFLLKTLKKGGNIHLDNLDVEMEVSSNQNVLTIKSQVSQGSVPEVEEKFKRGQLLLIDIDVGHCYVRISKKVKKGNRKSGDNDLQVTFGSDKREGFFIFLLKYIVHFCEGKDYWDSFRGYDTRISLGTNIQFTKNNRSVQSNVGSNSMWCRCSSYDKTKCRYNQASNDFRIPGKKKSCMKRGKRKNHYFYNERCFKYIDAGLKVNDKTKYNPRDQSNRNYYENLDYVSIVMGKSLKEIRNILFLSPNTAILRMNALTEDVLRFAMNVGVYQWKWKKNHFQTRFNFADLLKLAQNTDVLWITKLSNFAETRRRHYRNILAHTMTSKKRRHKPMEIALQFFQILESVYKMVRREFLSVRKEKKKIHPRLIHMRPESKWKKNINEEELLRKTSMSLFKLEKTKKKDGSESFCVFDFFPSNENEEKEMLKKCIHLDFHCAVCDEKIFSGDDIESINVDHTVPHNFRFERLSVMKTKPNKDFETIDIDNKILSDFDPLTKCEAVKVRCKKCGRSVGEKYSKVDGNFWVQFVIVNSYGQNRLYGYYDAEKSNNGKPKLFLAFKPVDSIWEYLRNGIFRRSENPYFFEEMKKKLLGIDKFDSMSKYTFSPEGDFTSNSCRGRDMKVLVRSLLNRAWKTWIGKYALKQQQQEELELDVCLEKIDKIFNQMLFDLFNSSALDPVLDHCMVRILSKELKGKTEAEASISELEVGNELEEGTKKNDGMKKDIAVLKPKLKEEVKGDKVEKKVNEEEEDEGEEDTEEED